MQANYVELIFTNPHYPLTHKFPLLYAMQVKMNILSIGLMQIFGNFYGEADVLYHER